MKPAEVSALDQIKAGMKGNDWRVQAVVTMRGLAIQVYAKPTVTGTYRKVGPLLFPPDGQHPAEVLRTLAHMMEEP